MKLERARQAFMTSYRNSQMISTDPVLKAALPTYDVLTDAYGRVKKFLATASRQDGVTSKNVESRSGIQHALNTEVEEAIRQMRQAMRLDLGVSVQTARAEDQ